VGWHVNDLTAATGAPVPNIDRPKGYVFEAQRTQHVIYVGYHDGHIHELWWDWTGWHDNDLSAAAGAPPVTSFDPAAYVFAAQGTQHVFHTASDGHIHELWWDLNGWHHNDLTAATGSPWAFGLTAYAFEAQYTQHVVYLGNPDFHIHELWWDSNGWHHNDLTATTGAPASDGYPAGHVFPAQGTQHVVHAAGGHVHELWWDSNGWHHNDLTAATGAPAGGDPAGYIFQAQGTQHVVYWGSDNHVQELWWDGNGWHHNDLTIAANVPGDDTIAVGVNNGNPVANPLFGYTFEAQGTQHVVYTTAGGHIRELWWDSNGWHCNDLTVAASAPVVFTPPDDPAGVYNPTGYVFNAQGSQHVVCVQHYSEDELHVYELYWVAGDYLDRERVDAALAFRRSASTQVG
jgi:hypothetical protein